MKILSIVAALLFSGMTAASKPLAIDPNCGVYLFGKTNAYVLEVRRTGAGLFLNEVADAVAPYGFHFTQHDGFVTILGETVLIPASRLASFHRPLPKDGELEAHGISIFSDPRPWSPGDARSLAPLRQARIRSFRALLPCEITFEEGVTLARAREILAEAGALYVGGEPLASAPDDWDVRALAASGTLARLGREPTVVARTYGFED